MSFATIELSDLTVKVLGPMHIGTGFARGLLNRTVVRGRDGLVYMPGSTLKGKARDACEALARLYELGECRAPHPQFMAKHRVEKCLVCRIFGAPAQPSTLRWHSAALTEDWRSALRYKINEDSRAIFGQTTVRTQAQLSRARGSAAEAKLYTSEFAASGLTFEAKPALTGRLQLTTMTSVDEPDVYYELVLLLAGLKLIGALGGGRSRGAGECEISLPASIRMNNREISVAKQLAFVEELRLLWEEPEAQP